MAIIYQASSMGDANLLVALVNAPGEADLCVYRVSSRGLAASEALWYITRNRNDAQVRLFFTSQGMAQLKVCFVSAMGEAGWQHPHRHKGRLGR